MKSKAIVFTGPDQVEVQQLEEDLEHLQEHEILVRTLYSLISAGTELACLSGSESWFGYPSTPGYTSVGEVVEVGTQVSGVAPGDIIYNWGGHKQYQRIDTTDPGSFFVKVPEGIQLSLVPFTRMITIAMTAVRISNIELGDYVGVIGLGLVGNFASQLAALQGGNVIGIDIDESRLAFASECRIPHTLIMNTETITGEIDTITKKQGVTTLIEATGIPRILPDVLPIVGRYGEVILLGSPRGVYETNLTEVLNYVHLDPLGCLTFKGAHEWRYPVQRNPFVKHSLERNTEVAMNLILSGGLQVEPLLTHLLKPDAAEQAYHGLKHQSNAYVGVVFDWTDEESVK